MAWEVESMGCQSKQINNARKFCRKTLLPAAVSGGGEEGAGSQEVFDLVKRKPWAMNMKLYLLILDSKPHLLSAANKLSFLRSLHVCGTSRFQRASRKGCGKSRLLPPPPFFSMQPLVSPLEGLMRCPLCCVSFLYDKVSSSWLRSAASLNFLPWMCSQHTFKY